MTWRHFTPFRTRIFILVHRPVMPHSVISIVFPSTEKVKKKEITSEDFSGINTYNIAPNSKYAIHSHTDANTPKTVRLVSLPKHKTVETLVDNKKLKGKLDNLELPKTEFFEVTTAEGINIDGRDYISHPF